MISTLEAATLHNANTVWCRALVQELVLSGMERAVVCCCGGRSAAMAMVLNTQPELETVIFNDERAGAFFALGLAKASGLAVGICTTSGSAVANLAPAVVEAKACGLPLILLTCDRPRSVRDAGAPQCADHLAICGGIVEAAVDFDDPEMTGAALESMRRKARDTLRLLRDPATRGPVHLNIPLHGRLTSTDQEPGWEAPSLPAELYASSVGSEPETVKPVRGSFDAARLEPLGLEPGLKGLIFVGPDAPVDLEALTAFAIRTGFPVFADAPSGLRRPQRIPGLICEGDLLLVSPTAAELRPDVLVRIGEAPVASTTQAYLQARTCPSIVLARRQRDRDFLARGTSVSLSPTEPNLSALADRLQQGDPAWLDGWLRMADEVRSETERYLSRLPWGECAAAWTICNTPGFDLFYLANSMSIRHGNLFCAASRASQHILVNRGVSGIDGTISSFLGALAATEGRGLLLIGDLAAAHDLTSLLHAGKSSLCGAICIINNGGGAIFDLLSCASIHDYERLVRNPPGIRFADIAAGFQLPFERCTRDDELSAALARAAVADRLCLIEVEVPPQSLQIELRELYLSFMLP